YADDATGEFIADSYAPISALHLMAAIGSLRSLDDVIYVLSERSEDLGDWLTESMASILAAFGVAILPKLEELASETGGLLDLYGRDACIRAIAVMARRNPAIRPEVVEFLKRLVERRGEDKTFV